MKKLAAIPCVKILFQIATARHKIAARCCTVILILSHSANMDVVTWVCPNKVAWKQLLTHPFPYQDFNGNEGGRLTWVYPSSPNLFLLRDPHQVASRFASPTLRKKPCSGTQTLLAAQASSLKEVLRGNHPMNGFNCYV